MDLSKSPLQRLPAACTIYFLPRSGWFTIPEHQKALDLLNSFNAPHIEGKVVPADGTLHGWALSFHEDRKAHEIDGLFRSWQVSELTNKEGQWVYTNRKLRLAPTGEVFEPKAETEETQPKPTTTTALVGGAILEVIPEKEMQEAEERLKKRKIELVTEEKVPAQEEQPASELKPIVCTKTDLRCTEGGICFCPRTD